LNVAEAARLDGRLAVVTGANGALGRAIVCALAEPGASLRLIGRNAAAIDALAETLPSTGSISRCIVDLTKPSEDEIAAAVVDADILINNAAIQGPIGPVWQNDWSAWLETLQVDLLSPVALARAAAPGMLARGWGRIISISGGGATGPRPNFTAYAVAKTGLVRFTETMAAELVSSGVTVNAIAPGAFKSSLTEDVLAAGDASGKQELAVASNLGTQATSDTIGFAARLCVFLATEAASGISGRLLAARWDDWENLPEHADALAESDLFTLRRITPQDRGIAWGSK